MNWCFHDFNFKILHSSSFHPVFVGSDFCIFANFGLGKVLWFCLTKVSGKNQSFTNLSWFCKNLQIGTKSGEKTKVVRYPRGQNPKKLQNIPELKSIQFQV